MKENDLDIVLVVPAVRVDENVDFFKQKHFEELYPFITFFSLVTYDFSNAQRPGANAPLYWIQHAVEEICPNSLPDYIEKRKKILIGLNMYGYDYTVRGGEANAIVGNQFLELLGHYSKPRLIHDEHDEENFFELT